MSHFACLIHVPSSLMNQPTTPPTPGPINNPTIPGMGYCSDDAGRQCSATTDCICGGASASPPDQAASSSSSTKLFDRTRHLQADCNHPKAKACNADANCQWNGGNGCGAIPTLPPTAAASDSPSKSPTNSPTKQPTSSPTEQPTSSPTANVS